MYEFSNPDNDCNSNIKNAGDFRLAKNIDF